MFRGALAHANTESACVQVRSPPSCEPTRGGLPRDVRIAEVVSKKEYVNAFPAARIACLSASRSERALLGLPPLSQGT
jgi:hypothetical protein